MTPLLLVTLVVTPLTAMSAGAAEPDEPASKARDGVVIEGALAGQGVECPLFRLKEGGVVSLSGQIPQLERDQNVRLIGRWSRISTCMQGKNFRVLGMSEVE